MVEVRTSELGAHVPPVADHEFTDTREAFEQPAGSDFNEDTSPLFPHPDRKFVKTELLKPGDEMKSMILPRQESCGITACQRRVLWCTLGSGRQCRRYAGCGFAQWKRVDLVVKCIVL